MAPESERKESQKTTSVTDLLERHLETWTAGESNTWINFASKNPIPERYLKDFEDPNPEEKIESLIRYFTESVAGHGFEFLAGWVIGKSPLLEEWSENQIRLGLHDSAQSRIAYLKSQLARDELNLPTGNNPPGWQKRYAVQIREITDITHAVLKKDVTLYPSV